ncbi:hypothetical protein AB0I10_26695 [Streptomyces sp. NPDC050636]|uniref:hypothetical protein n=1 Tax=Streptomyces sp. NPDC050636 TaxID=3154510 RepID=UPI00343417A2
MGAHLKYVDSDLQLWRTTSLRVPADSWEANNKKVRLRAENGSYRDAEGSGANNLTNAIVRPRKHTGAPVRQPPVGAH